jgi:hypothetical protein
MREMHINDNLDQTLSEEQGGASRSEAKHMGVHSTKHSLNKQRFTYIHLQRSQESGNVRQREEEKHEQARRSG